MSSPFQKKFSAKSPIGPTPLTKKSPCYQNEDNKSGDGDKKSGNLPQQVDEYPNSRLVREGSVVRERATGKVVIGGGYDDAKRFIPKPASQIEGERKAKAEIKKAKFKKRKEAEFNKPENVAKRKANKAKLEAAKAARAARDKKRGK
jgi:hypothetical protein